MCTLLPTVGNRGEGGGMDTYGMAVEFVACHRAPYEATVREWAAVMHRRFPAIDPDTFEAAERYIRGPQTPERYTEYRMRARGAA